MNHVRISLHKGVMPGSHWRPTRANQYGGPHLRSGQLSGSCLYAVLTALVVLDVTTVGALRQAPELDGDLLEEIWSAGQADYPSYGTDEAMVAKLLSIAAPAVHSVAQGESHDERQIFVEQHLRKGGIALLKLGAVDLRQPIWTLAVGIEEQVSVAGADASGILCLDSAETPPMVSRFNARLDPWRDSGFDQRSRYVLAGGDARLVTIYQSIGLRRARRRTAIDSV